MALYASLPKNYLCKSCDKKGNHWIMDCPTKLNEIPLEHEWSNLRKNNPIQVQNLKMIFKGKNPIALKGKIYITRNLTTLEQDDMLSIATWRNYSIFSVNKKITTKYIEFSVPHSGKICNDKVFFSGEKLFRFHFKFDPYTSTLYIKVKKALPKFFPNSRQEIQYEETCRVLKIAQVLKTK